MKIDNTIKTFCKIFKNSGYQCYLVGGAVRNIVLKKKPSDYDFATDAHPENVISIFKSVIPTGIEHGTVTVLFRGYKFEVTTFRIDGAYSNNRHPDSITYSNSIILDLSRRDFTMNAIAIDPFSEKIIDPQNGKDDIKKRLIRAIGVAEERFAEDGLRVLRACRFTAQLDFSIEEKTLEGMKKEASRLKFISAERIRDELIKILLSDQPSKAFRIMLNTGILEFVIPELIKGYSIKQREMHKFDVFEHSIIAADFAEKNIVIKLAALLHDVGKPQTLVIKENIPTFYNHEIKSAEIAEEILTRLKFSKNIIKQVTHLIAHHMFNYTDDWTDSAIRRFILKVGAENISDLLKLRAADRAGMTGEYHTCNSFNNFIERIAKIIEHNEAFTIKNLEINGNILSDKAGIPKGPKIGTVLNFLLDSVIEDPALNNKDKLLEIARNFYQRRLNID